MNRGILNIQFKSKIILDILDLIFELLVILSENNNNFVKRYFSCKTKSNENIKHLGFNFLNDLLLWEK